MKRKANYPDGEAHRDKVQFNMTYSVAKFGRFFLLPYNQEKEALEFFSSDTSAVQEIKNLTTYLKRLSAKYLLILDSDREIACDKISLRQMLKVFENKKVGIVYSDFILREGNKLIQYPLIDYQTGSIRDDFNFGHLLIYSCDAVQNALKKYGSLPSDAHLAFYDLRLKISADYDVIRMPKFLYKASIKQQKKIKISGRKTEAHFSYVSKENFIRQKKLEKIATDHLKRIGAYLPARTKVLDKEANDCQWKASIVIPVLNRKKTIGDALKSALEQKTDFPFNIIVVDNYSTDGTTDILKRFTARYPHVHHLIPQRRDLGIGGCWNEAIYSSYCGRYVVQLDSDDLYSSSHTLQKIVHAMRHGRYAMLVGSYTLVDEHLKKIPPGLIDHREWTPANGHNNLLRVNGMGAPRAFDLSVIRRMGFPNVSYGEDYAAALHITRDYKVGRIYENLYWCRRWKDNTDAGLSVGKKNRHDFYKDQLRSGEIEARKKIKETRTYEDERIFAELNGSHDLSLPVLCQSLCDSQKLNWPKLAGAVRDLNAVQSRKLAGPYKVYLQYNSARAVNSGARIDAESISKRPCFLCQENLPAEQKGILYRNQYLILCNPMPIFENHYTIVSLRHEPQEITLSIPGLLSLSAEMKGYAVFYNGPACGASAPDHLHFQAVPRNKLPFLSDLKKLLPFEDLPSVKYGCLEDDGRSVVVLESKNTAALREQFLNLIKAAGKIMKTDGEPMVNVIGDYNSRVWRLVVFLRRKHRPDVYFAKGESRIFISPGSVDMAGVVITPRLDNYNGLDYNAIREIYREVSLPEAMMNEILKEL